MKKLLLILLAFTTVYTVNAQIETPQPSPKAKFEQKVGLTDITIEYSRPGVKGRKVFGDLESFGTIWRTGANENTKITFSNDVEVAGKALKAGTYALFTRLISATEWEFLFYTDTNNWGTPQNWDDSKVAVSAKVAVEPIPFVVETFTIDINSITNNGAKLELLWENSYAAVPFTVPTEQTVSKAIDKVMAGPGEGDYYAAAAYYLAEGKDMKKATEWIDKAVEMTKDNPRFYYLRRQALIHAANGDKAGAIKAAKESLVYSKKAGNDGYIKMNTASLKEWGAM
ncbi:DUF2911 domain-containing protein [Algibacter lectus]|uniref:DUF2911 family protein n=1 Tax=Algibacter lectus TaxID=221126 RepID=A0A090W4Z4_9FLAO|nr:DUF2911 domain-containing protein [Algibacter lectus]MWW25186.1 DUF2911 domain-containing protein [Algibacter lectus]TDY64399.1 DUF2911 family protein [Algibacter lectus]GAL62602.1 hypothetical protein JCM19300_263 [Algibacter lectus]SFC08560.1 Protein of unknown function [Algibacter lectus]